MKNAMQEALKKRIDVMKAKARQQSQFVWGIRSDGEGSNSVPPSLILPKLHMRCNRRMCRNRLMRLLAQTPRPQCRLRCH